MVFKRPNTSKTWLSNEISVNHFVRERNDTVIFFGFLYQQQGLVFHFKVWKLMCTFFNFRIYVEYFSKDQTAVANQTQRQRTSGWTQSIIHTIKYVISCPFEKSRPIIATSSNYWTWTHHPLAIHVTLVLQAIQMGYPSRKRSKTRDLGPELRTSRLFLFNANVRPKATRIQSTIEQFHPRICPPPSLSGAVLKRSPLDGLAPLHCCLFLPVHLTFFDKTLRSRR